MGLSLPFKDSFEFEAVDAGCAKFSHGAIPSDRGCRALETGLQEMLH